MEASLPSESWLPCSPSPPFARLRPAGPLSLRWWPRYGWWDLVTDACDADGHIALQLAILEPRSDGASAHSVAHCYSRGHFAHAPTAAGHARLGSASSAQAAAAAATRQQWRRRRGCAHTGGQRRRLRWQRRHRWRQPTPRRCPDRWHAAAGGERGATRCGGKGTRCRGGSTSAGASSCVGSRVGGCVGAGGGRCGPWRRRVRVRARRRASLCLCVVRVSAHRQIAMCGSLGPDAHEWRHPNHIKGLGGELEACGGDARPRRSSAAAKLQLTSRSPFKPLQQCVSARALYRTACPLPELAPCRHAYESHKSSGPVHHELTVWTPPDEPSAAARATSGLMAYWWLRCSPGACRARFTALYHFMHIQPPWGGRPRKCRYPTRSTAVYGIPGLEQGF